MGICESERNEQIEKVISNPNSSNQNSTNNIIPAPSIQKVPSFTNINNSIIKTNFQSKTQININSEKKK